MGRGAWIESRLRRRTSLSGTSAAIRAARMTSATTMRKNADVCADDDLINDIALMIYDGSGTTVERA
jgi:hypothetical protein